LRDARYVLTRLDTIIIGPVIKHWIFDSLLALIFRLSHFLLSLVSGLEGFLQPRYGIVRHLIHLHVSVHYAYYVCLRLPLSCLKCLFPWAFSGAHRTCAIFIRTFERKHWSHWSTMKWRSCVSCLCYLNSAMMIYLFTVKEVMGRLVTETIDDIKVEVKFYFQWSLNNAHYMRWVERRLDSPSFE
jgi:hypothetical protein